MFETKEALYYNVKFTRSINVFIPKGNTQILTTRYCPNCLEKEFHNTEYNWITHGWEYIVEKTKCWFYKQIEDNSNDISSKPSILHESQGTTFQNATESEI